MKTFNVRARQTRLVDLVVEAESKEAVWSSDYDFIDETEVASEYYHVLSVEEAK